VQGTSRGKEDFQVSRDDNECYFPMNLLVVKYSCQQLNELIHASLPRHFRLPSLFLMHNYSNVQGAFRALRNCVLIPRHLWRPSYENRIWVNAFIFRSATLFMQISCIMYNERVTRYCTCVNELSRKLAVQFSGDTRRKRNWWFYAITRHK
jgi:hypothetical protein